MVERKLSGPPPKLAAIGPKCDTHLHFYDDKYKPLPGTPSPAAASVADYRQVMKWLGIERSVVVQPNAYGDDNRCTIDAVTQLGPSARAVVW
jgi:D-galactarolactone isomerase